jgi:hypothetical protein
MHSAAHAASSTAAEEHIHNSRNTRIVKLFLRNGGGWATLSDSGGNIVTSIFPVVL